MIEREEFEAWQENPVTLAVFAVLKVKADEAKRQWFDASWDGGSNDPLLLADLRASSQAWDYVRQMEFEEMEAILADE